MEAEIGKSKKPSAIVLGGSGLVGSHCLKTLAESGSFDHILDAGRRPSGISHPGIEYRHIDFENPASLRTALAGDCVFCCLGTTHAKAGSKAAFRKVDLDFVLNAAKAAKENGASAFLLVSSIGANEHSLFHYSRVKGEVERRLKEMQFDSLHIFRPSVLLGQRKDHRPGEKFLQSMYPPLSFLFSGPLKRYAGTNVEMLSRAMLHAALSGKKGHFIHEAETLEALADSLKK